MASLNPDRFWIFFQIDTSTWQKINPINTTNLSWKYHIHVITSALIIYYEEIQQNLDWIKLRTQYLHTLDIFKFTVWNGIQPPGCNDLYEIICGPSVIVSKIFSSMGLVPGDQEGQKQYLFLKIRRGLWNYSSARNHQEDTPTNY